MKTSLALSALVLMPGLLALSANASAGTLSWEALEVLTTNGVNGAEGSTLIQGCEAVTERGTEHDTNTCSGTVKITFQYVGSATDGPPSSVRISYDARMKGSVSYYLAGVTPPNGTASANYTGYVRDFYGPPDLTLLDSIGPISQTTSDQESTVNTTQLVDGSTVPTPVNSWTYTDSPNGVRTYTSPSITFATYSGTATADCDAEGRGSHTAASWKYVFNYGSITLH